VGGVGGVFFF